MSVPEEVNVTSSVTEPVSGPVMVGTSSVPVIVKVIVVLEVAPVASRMVYVNDSVTTCPATNASAAGRLAEYE